jgi:calcium-dependent protein kinase
LGEARNYKDNIGRQLALGSVQRLEKASDHERVIIFLFSLKKTILMYLAVQISEKEIEDLRKIFVKLDVNGNGMISRDEMMIGLDYLRKEVNANLSNNDIDQIFTAMDFDTSGQVDYTEFIASFLDATISKN